jgi:hypothetical protein
MDKNKNSRNYAVAVYSPNIWVNIQQIRPKYVVAATVFDVYGQKHSD